MKLSFIVNPVFLNDGWSGIACHGTMGYMKYITLHGKLAKSNKAKIDDQDHDLVSKYRWNVDADGYAISVGKRLKMHRLVMGAQKGQIVDHINRNKLDNRKKNLRFVTHAQNMFNLNDKPGKTGYRGVSYATSKTIKYQANISINNKTKYLGTYDTPEEAHTAYLEAKRRFHETIISS